MALTIQRWTAVALLGCAVLVVAEWPPSETPWQPTRSYPDHLPEVIKGNAYWTAGQLAVLEKRDEVLATLRRTGNPSDPTSVIRFDLSLSQGARRALTAAFDQVAAELRPFAPEIVTRVIIVPESDRIRGSMAGSWYFFPEATDGHTCLVIAFAPNWSQDFMRDADSRSFTDLHDWGAQELGPCAFYAAFGIPSPSIATWLRGHNYRFARNADWQSARLPIDHVPRDQAASSLPLLHLLFGGTFWTPDAFARDITRSCANGAAAACRIVLDSVSWDDRTAFGTRYAVSHPQWEYWSIPQSGWLLADLVHTFGRDKFAQFWGSPLPRDAAFTAAFGTDIVDYTHRWLRGSYERLQVGPSISASGVLLGLAVVGIGVGVAAAYARRRQVG